MDFYQGKVRESHAGKHQDEKDKQDKKIQEEQNDVVDLCQGFRFKVDDPGQQIKKDFHEKRIKNAQYKQPGEKEQHECRHIPAKG